MGLLSYYGNFLPQLATKLASLYALLSSATPWRWTKKEAAAFQDSKELLLSSQVLVHFDLNQELVLSCALKSSLRAKGLPTLNKIPITHNPYGVVAILSHRFSDGTDRVIGFASRSLTKAERKYSQLEKDGLACIFGVKRFHSYLYGRKFTLITDHKPLLGLLGEIKVIPTQASARIQRWALTLVAYEYTCYRSGGNHGNTDAMSRLALQGEATSVPVPEVLQVVLLMEHLQDSPTSVADIRMATSHHPVLSHILQFVRCSWPNQCREEELKPFCSRQTDLSVEDGYLLWGDRVVVPPSL